MMYPVIKLDSGADHVTSIEVFLISFILTLCGEGREGLTEIMFIVVKITELVKKYLFQSLKNVIIQVSILIS